MKILVLGGSGFVGTNVCQLLKNQNYDIKSASLRDGFDFTNFSSTIECFKKYEPDIIINLAAKVGSLNFVTQQAADVIDVNMRMLLNIFKAVEETSDKLVLINPVANCGYPGTINEYSEEKFWDGKVHQSVIAYGNTRRMIEILAECYKMQYGLKIINFFVPNMYGPFDSTDPNKAHALNALVSKIVKANFEKRREFEVWGSGIAVREWLFAKDFGKIIAQTIENLDSFVYKETVNIAQNYGLSIRELVDIIVKEVDYDGEIVWNRSMPDGAPRKVMNDIRFQKQFPNFIFTSLNEGIRETTKYYQAIYPY